MESTTTKQYRSSRIKGGAALRKRRKIQSPGQARKPIYKTSRSEKWSGSASAFMTALELARLDTSQTKRSRPVGTSSPVYPPLLNQVIPPAGVVLPPIEEPQQNDQSTLGHVQQSGPIREGPVTFISVLYISLVLGSLLHSWWVLGESLLIGLILTGIIVLFHKREIFQALIAVFLWFLFALIWGYIGWLVCDPYMPLIIHCLCAFIGFILGFVGHFVISGIVNYTQYKRVRERKYCGLTTFVDSVCISLVFGFLLHSWWMLGVSLLIGLILTGISVIPARDNVRASNRTSVDMVWLLFALMWGYAGWLVFDSHISSIVHFLCAVIGFTLGLVGYPLAYVILSPPDVKVQVVGEMK